MKLLRTSFLCLAMGLTAPAVGQEDSRTAFSLDTDSPAIMDLSELLDASMAGLLELAQFVKDTRPKADMSPAEVTSLDKVIQTLEQHNGVVYVLLADRDKAKDSESLQINQIYVIPDVVRLTLRAKPNNTNTMTPSESPSRGTQHLPVPEVTIIESESGDQPMIKFEFDPERYIQSQ